MYISLKTIAIIIKQLCLFITVLFFFLVATKFLELPDFLRENEAMYSIIAKIAIFCWFVYNVIDCYQKIKDNNHKTITFTTIEKNLAEKNNNV